MNDKDFFNQFKYDPEKDLLGSGGFGSVYRAYDKQEKRYVAIKISQVKDIFGKFTLLNEVELSKSIDDHTNVARYEFGLRVMHPFPVDYAVMAYYEEGNLDMLLRKRNGQFNEKEFFEIVDGLLEGIKHLHHENIIHRDLKLANILMHRTKQGQWRPKIADFGLSRQMGEYDASVSNSAIGITVAYAAPEQIENKPIRRNVDLWAFGVILYRLFTGEMPFAPTAGADATSANMEISRKISQVELPPKLELLPEPYQTIIRRCWVKDTKDRAQEAAELLDILKSKKGDFNISNTHSITLSSSSYTQPVEMSAKVAPLEQHLEDLPPSPKGVLGTVFEPILDKTTGEKPPLLMLNATLSDSEPTAVVDATIVEKPSGSVHDKTPSTPINVIDATIVEKPSGNMYDKTPSAPKTIEDETIVEKPSGNMYDKTPSIPKADASETLIDIPSESLSMPSSTWHDETIIDNPSQPKKPETVSPTPKTGNNKQRMAIGGVLLCFLLGFGIWKFMPKSGEDSTTMVTNPLPQQQEAGVQTPPLPEPIPVPAPNQENTAVKNPPVSTPKPNQPIKPANPSTGTTQPVPENYPKPTYTPSTPQYRTPTTNPLPPMDDASTGGRNATPKVEKPAESAPATPSTRKTEENNNELPKLVNQGNILGSLKCPSCLDKCETCSEDFTKGGTIILSDFTIKADGKMSTNLDPRLTIKNHKGEISTNAGFKKRVLEILVKDFKWEASSKEFRYVRSLTIGF